jgi:hypothetical protein
MQHTLRTKVPREPATQQSRATVRICDVLEPESPGYIDWPSALILAFGYCFGDVPRDLMSSVRAFATAEEFRLLIMRRGSRPPPQFDAWGGRATGDARSRFLTHRLAPSFDRIPSDDGFRTVVATLR